MTEEEIFRRVAPAPCKWEYKAFWRDEDCPGEFIFRHHTVINGLEVCCERPEPPEPKRKETKAP